MTTLRSFVSGQWTPGRGKPATLVNPSTEEALAEASSEGVDFGAAMRFARDTGGPALRALTFAQRGELLHKWSKLIHAHRDALIELAIANGGNTRGDAKFDIDGASGTLAAYAVLGREIGERKTVVDGEALRLARSPRWMGQHVLVPKHGVAVHINAFNFPAWGFGEKAAVALLAGQPVVVKPATATALLAHRITELLVESAIFPAGAITFIAGGAGDLLDHVGPQDTLAFTGSSDTGARLRAHPAVVRANLRVNVEADSLNAAVLGPDVEPGSDLWRIFIHDVVRDMTQKTGQKCTAIRRVMVPKARMDQVIEDLGADLGAIRVGNPADTSVTMGPVSTAQQLADLRAGIDKLSSGGARVAFRQAQTPVAAPAGKGYFHEPVLLRADDARKAAVVHGHEVFGPVATVMAHDGGADAAALVALGGGSLVSSVYSDDKAFTEEAVLGSAAWAGRLHVVSTPVVEGTTQPGMVLPSLIHGGPGRAGGGEELGGRRGLAFYLQRTAIAANSTFLESL